MLQEPRWNGLTYENFYGLREKPFSLGSDSRFFYHSRSHAPAFDDLLAGIRRRESLNVLTGDIGTGKTTLCRAVLQDLDRKTFSAFVPDPFATREDLLKVVLMDFGVLSVDDLTSGRLKGASRTELSYLLYEFLATLSPLQAFAVVVIDEAQNLSSELLEEIRILSDSDGRERQLQVVLIGQLELRDKLKLPEMRQVDQRVSVHCNLEPLGSDGVAGYVAHRLQIAGGSPDRVRFSDEAIDAIYQVSGGVPRIINRICDRALNRGYIRRLGTIDRETVQEAVPDAIQSVVRPAAAPVVPAGTAAVPAPARPISIVPPPAAAIPTELRPPLQVAAPVLMPVPVTATDEYPDPVDAWLALIDEGPKAASAARRLAEAVPRPPNVARPERLIPQTPPAVDVLERARHSRPRFVPRTQVQKFTHRWTRRLGVAVVWMVCLSVATVSGASLWNLSTDLWELSAPLMTLPLPPRPVVVMAPAIALPTLAANDAIQEPITAAGFTIIQSSVQGTR